MAERAALILATLLAGACSGCPDAFDLSESREVAPGERIVLAAPDGELVVTGRERATTVEIRARGCAAGGAARIDFDTADGARAARVMARHADVRAYVPAGAELLVRHGSGDVEIRAVGPLALTTRGGDARIEQVIGDVSVQAGPGTLYVREVVGSVDVVDGPGAVFVEGVMGDVRVRDGSGGLHLREIEGDVVVEADGSGTIDARTIAGDFIVRAKAEDLHLIRHDDVAGAVELPD